MKQGIMLLLIVLAMMYVSGCGVIESMNDHCGGTHEDLCHAILGGREDEKQDERAYEQQTQIDNTILLLNDLNISLISQINMIEYVSSITHANVQSQINALQTNINNNSLQIAVLQGYQNISAILDVCGDGPGVDEVLFRTSSGKILASFSQNASGLNTRFAVITNGTYTTTDGTNCTFTISGSNVTPSVEVP